MRIVGLRIIYHTEKKLCLMNVQIAMTKQVLLCNTMPSPLD